MCSAIHMGRLEKTSAGVLVRRRAAGPVSSKPVSQAVKSKLLRCCCCYWQSLPARCPPRSSHTQDALGPRLKPTTHTHSHTHAARRTSAEGLGQARGVVAVCVGEEVGLAGWVLEAEAVHDEPRASHPLDALDLARHCVLAAQLLPPAIVVFGGLDLLARGESLC